MTLDSLQEFCLQESCRVVMEIAFGTAGLHASLRGCVSVLEIVFVGQCEVFCLFDFVHFFPPWP